MKLEKLRLKLLHDLAESIEDGNGRKAGRVTDLLVETITPALPEEGREELEEFRQNQGEWEEENDKVEVDDESIELPSVNYGMERLTYAECMFPKLVEILSNNESLIRG